MSTKLDKDIKGGALSIRSRIILFATVPLLVLLIISGLGFYAFKTNTDSLNNINTVSEKTQGVSSILKSLESNIIYALYSSYITELENHQASTAVTIGVQRFNEDWDNFLKSDVLKNGVLERLLIDDKEFMDKELAAIQKRIALLRAELINPTGITPPGQDSVYYDSVAYNVAGMTSPLRTRLEQEIDLEIKESAVIYKEAIDWAELSTKIIAGTVLLGLLLTLLATLAFYKSLSRPIKHLSSVMDELSKGNTEARSRLAGNDELTRLGKTFNVMMNDRETLQEQMDKDNEAINHSVFSLLDAVSDLSERDLTVRAQVTEDATGPLADAINQLAEDTTDVLEEVKSIAMSVEQTSASVNERSQEVNKLATVEQEEAQETAKQIENIRQRLETIAQSAIETNDIADATSGATQEAYQSVSRSMDSIGEIRNTVQDTGKRIKRLGERSQEISYITDIINGIAERTTVLALNANMQAMAAGDAGKGFSVIADEIQRLAESSRESTEQITQLVKNIQQETTATIATMDHTIEQVVQGAALADEATNQMQQTLDSTNKLTSSVNDIASASKEQMEMSDTLQARASRIMETTTATGQEMSLLAQLTGDMSQYAKQLVQSVNVFKLKS